MIKLSYGHTDMGLFDTIEDACNHASHQAFVMGNHHQFDWPYLRSKARQMTDNDISFSYGGWGFVPTKQES